MRRIPEGQRWRGAVRRRPPEATTLLPSAPPRPVVPDRASRMREGASLRGQLLLGPDVAADAIGSRPHRGDPGGDRAQTVIDIAHDVQPARSAVHEVLVHLLAALAALGEQDQGRWVPFAGHRPTARFLSTPRRKCAFASRDPRPVTGIIGPRSRLGRVDGPSRN